MLELEDITPLSQNFWPFSFWFSMLLLFLLALLLIGVCFLFWRFRYSKPARLRREILAHFEFFLNDLKPFFAQNSSPHYPQAVEKWDRFAKKVCFTLIQQPLNSKLLKRLEQQNATLMKHSSSQHLHSKPPQTLIKVQDWQSFIEVIFVHYFNHNPEKPFKKPPLLKVWLQLYQPHIEPITWQQFKLQSFQWLNTLLLFYQKKPVLFYQALKTPKPHSFNSL